MPRIMKAASSHSLSQLLLILAPLFTLITLNIVSVDGRTTLEGQQENPFLIMAPESLEAEESSDWQVELHKSPQSNGDQSDGDAKKKKKPICSVETMTEAQKQKLKENVKILLKKNHPRHNHPLLRFKRSTLNKQAKIWNNIPALVGKQFFYIIPWRKVSHYDNADFTPVLEAIDEIEKKTCIRFDHIDTSEKKFLYGGKQFLEIVNEPGCHSVIGRHTGESKDEIVRNILKLELGPKIIIDPKTGTWTRRTCMKHKVILHELLHLLGLFHEHQRSDRDKWLEVIDANVQTKKEKNFVPVTDKDETWGIPYNFASIMNYRDNAFANVSGEKTIVIKRQPDDCEMQFGMLNDASPLDFVLVNLLYNCPGIEQRVDALIDNDFKVGYQQHKTQITKKHLEAAMMNAVQMELRRIRRPVPAAHHHLHHLYHHNKISKPVKIAGMGKAQQQQKHHRRHKMNSNNNSNRRTAAGGGSRKGKAASGSGARHHHRQHQWKRRRY